MSENNTAKTEIDDQIGKLRQHAWIHNRAVEIKVKGLALKEQAGMFSGAADLIESQAKRVAELELIIKGKTFVTPEPPRSALALAVRFHETYERLAPSFGYETRQETRSFDPESKNGRLMVAVCTELGGDVLPSEAQPIAYLHEITEPEDMAGGNYHRMYSESNANPWSHWVASHKDRCKYVRTALYARPAVETGGRSP